MENNNADFISAGKALARLGQNENSRRKLVSFLRETEPELTELDFDSRLEVIAPILDVVFDGGEILTKRVQTAPDRPVLDFDYYYRSQIARGLVLSQPEVSDHLWEPQTTKLLLHLVRKASTVVIGGAYFGDHAIPAAQELNMEDRGRKGIVHCFEMDRAQLDLCRLNARQNKLDNLVFHNKALYARDGVHLGLVGEDAAACAKEVSSEEPQAVNSMTLSSLAGEQGLDRLDVLMLDIEGGELDALYGGEEFLSRPAGRAPDIIFEIHRLYTDWSRGLENTEIVRYLKSFGYHVFAIRDYQSNVDLRGYPVELIPPETCYLEGPPHGFNMVAVKDISTLQGEGFRFVNKVSPKLLFHRDPALHAPGKG